MIDYYYAPQTYRNKYATYYRVYRKTEERWHFDFIVIRPKECQYTTDAIDDTKLAENWLANKDNEVRTITKEMWDYQLLIATGFI